MPGVMLLEAAVEAMEDEVVKADEAVEAVPGGGWWWWWALPTLWGAEGGDAGGWKEPLPSVLLLLLCLLSALLAGGFAVAPAAVDEVDGDIAGVGFFGGRRST
mmetsp:Transcript_80509/g.167773  ORF Transcript_80509/g.167773 Transcript_80509/m.167773 type:complete len:103 (-) Transcript_80509:718-1026(-)